MQLESLYQEIILDHYRNPQNKGLREPFDAQVHAREPDLRRRGDAPGGAEGRRRRAGRG